MHDAAAYLAEETAQRGVAPQRGNASAVIYREARRIAAKFHRLTISVRAAAVAIAVLTPVIVVVLGVARLRAGPVIIDWPEADLRRTWKSTPAACKSQQYGHLICWLNIDGTDIASDIDGMSDRILYMAKSTQMPTLGDLIVHWGTPSGTAYYKLQYVVFWGTRTAYFRPCSVQPDSRVIYFGYGLSPKEILPWRGFVSTTLCTAN
jgi:hypothetical protein